jgi:hypothetical protein
VRGVPSGQLYFFAELLHAPQKLRILKQVTSIYRGIHPFIVPETVFLLFAELLHAPQKLRILKQVII